MQKSNAANCTVFIPPATVSRLLASLVLVSSFVPISSSLLSSSSSSSLLSSPLLPLSPSLRTTSCFAASINRWNAFFWRLLKPYGGVCHVLCCCVRTKNITICCHDWHSLRTRSRSRYGSNGAYRTWSISVRMASKRNITPLRRTPLSAMAAMSPTAFQTTLAMPSSRSSACSSGFRIAANKSPCGHPVKYGTQPVRRNHGFTSSLSPGRMMSHFFFCS